jgi:hypothetical protein
MRASSIPVMAWKSKKERGVDKKIKYFGVMLVI